MVMVGMLVEMNMDLFSDLLGFDFLDRSDCFGHCIDKLFGPGGNINMAQVIPSDGDFSCRIHDSYRSVVNSSQLTGLEGFRNWEQYLPRLKSDEQNGTWK